MTVQKDNQSLDYLGLAGDAKPTAGILAGTQFYETDTGATYIYTGSAWVLKVGSGSGGIVGGGGAGYSVVVTLTRPNNSTPYTAGDVVGAAAAALTFPNMGPAGGEIMITSATLEIDVAAVPSGMTGFTLRLYNITPPSALADNAVWDLPSGDRASYLGHINLGTPADLGSTLRISADGINKQVKLAGTSLFAYLCTDGGYTPTANAVKVISVHAVAL